MRAASPMLALFLVILASLACRQAGMGPVRDPAGAVPPPSSEPNTDMPQRLDDVQDQNITRRMRMYAERIERADEPVPRLNALYGLIMQLSQAVVRGRPVRFSSAIDMLGPPDAWVDDPEYAGVYLLEGDWEIGSVALVFNYNGVAHVGYNVVEAIDATRLKKLNARGAEVPTANSD